MESVPCVYVEGLSEAQRRAYILADNRLTELGEWDMLYASQLMEMQLSLKKKSKLTCVFIAVLMVVLTAGCGKPYHLTLPEIIDKMTISWDGGSLTTFSYTDPVKTDSLKEYFSSLDLNSTWEDPANYAGGGWDITVKSGTETMEMQLAGNRFLLTSDKKCWEISYEQACKFEELLKTTLPDELPQNIIFDEWKQEGRK